MLIRRRKPDLPFPGTDAEGYKPPGCPKYWPFGMQRPVKSIAKPKVGKK